MCFPSWILHILVNMLQLEGKKKWEAQTSSGLTLHFLQLVHRWLSMRIILHQGDVQEIFYFMRSMSWGLFAWLTGIYTYQSQLWLPPACPTWPNLGFEVCQKTGSWKHSFSNQTVLSQENTVCPCLSTVRGRHNQSICACSENWRLGKLTQLQRRWRRILFFFFRKRISAVISEVPISTWIKLTRAGAVKHGNSIPFNPWCQRHLAVTTPNH